VVRVDADEIQERIDERFPRRYKKLVLELRLESPRVSIGSGSKRLEITFRVTGLLGGVQTGHALATVTGGVRYDPQRGEFYLTDPHVIRTDASYLPREYLEPAREVVDRLVSHVLPVVPIHRLDRSRHRIERALLKRAWICEGQLCLEMGI
jgi:hypothetical protein